MKARKQTTTTQRDWTKTFPYACLVLMATLASTGVLVYKTMKSDSVQGREQPASTPSPTPMPTPSPTPWEKNPEVLARQQRVCSEWIFALTGGRYNFVCRGSDTFDIYVVRDNGSKRVGAGKIGTDGSVEGDLLIPKHPDSAPRHSHWSLKITTDGKRLEGTHYGEDPREEFPLIFDRAL
jgi:hypothetical protein